MTIEFVPKELWHKLEYKGMDYYEGIGIECKNLVGIKLKRDKDHTVRSVWERACRYVGYDEADYPDISEVIREKNSGILLKDLPV